MWLSPTIATQEAVEKLANTYKEELYSAAKACVSMSKTAQGHSVYALSGRLIGSKSGYLLLEVPNAVVRGLFDALHEPGAELPPDLDAHITVMRKEEVEQAGGLDKITERGHSFRYQLGPIQTVNPQGWPEFTKCWYVKIRSPELEKLRKSYGLSAKPRDNEHDFHITIAVRKKTVLQENEVSKVAADVQHTFITGASGAGKSTLAKALAEKTQRPLLRLDDHPEFKELIKQDPDLNRATDPELHKKWQELRQRMVQEAVSRPTPHIIEGTQILGSPELTEGHQRILVDTPLRQIIRQRLARERGKYAKNPDKYADRNPGKPGSTEARQRADRARAIYNVVEPELKTFRTLPGVESVPSRNIQNWLAKQSTDSMGFVSGPSIAPDATDAGEPITDRPQDTGATSPVVWEEDPTAEVQGRSMPFEDKGIPDDATKQAALSTIVRAVAGRYIPMQKEAGEYIGHYRPETKVVRESFGYLPPKGDKDSFAQCGTCIAFTGSDHNTCTILGKEHVTKDMSCNFYQHGKPNPAGAGKEKRILTPKQAGLVDRQVRCENCAFADADDPEHPYCELYEHLNEKWPDVFDLDKSIESKACCNFQTPKGPKVEEDAKEAALWYLHDELSKEKEASANRISLTVIDANQEQVSKKLLKLSASIPPTAWELTKRIGTGALGAGALAGAGAMIYQGVKKPGMSLLDVGHNLWTEPENKERLAQSIGDPAQSEAIFNLANTNPKQFRSLLSGRAVPDIDPDLQRRVHDITFSSNKPHMRSRVGDILLSGANKGTLNKILPIATGSSVAHAASGGLAGGDWASYWSPHAPGVGSTRPYFKQHELSEYSPLRVEPYDVSPPDFRIGLRPHEGLANTRRSQQFRNWIENLEGPFGEGKAIEHSFREVVPELNYGTSNIGSKLSKFVMANPLVRKAIAATIVPKSYKSLIAKGYPPDVAAEICSTFTANAIKTTVHPSLIPGDPSTYSPAKLLSLAEKGGPYGVHQVELPADMATPEALRSEHRKVKWGPLAWRLPIAAGLAASGGYLGLRALTKSSATHGVLAGTAFDGDKRISVCPYCDKKLTDKDIYTDIKGWKFCRACLRKGRGAIKLGFSGGLGSGAEGGQSSTIPPKPMNHDGSTPAGGEYGAFRGLFDRILEGTESTQKPLNNTGISERNRNPIGSPSYQGSSAIGAQGRMFGPSSLGAPRASQGFGFSAPAITNANDDTKNQLDSSTAEYGQIPHLNA